MTTAQSKTSATPNTADGSGGLLLDVQDLTVEIDVSRGVVHALTNVSFSIRTGEIVGIIGETGSGKTTVARTLIGLLPARARIANGIARFHSDDVAVDLLRCKGEALRRLRGRAVGFVPQSTVGALNPVLTIERQFASTVRAHQKMGRRESRKRCLEMLHRVGIRDPELVMRGHPYQLSGGMAQRVVLGMALALDPALIIADEPTTGLDVTVQKQLLDEMAALIQKRSQAMLLITHDIGVVANYCQRVVVLYGGHVVEEGPVAEVLARPAHPYTRVLLEAIPRAGRDLRVLGGAVGDLMSLPRGCPFYERCPVRGDPRCENTRPPLVTVSDQHRVATFCREGVT